MELYDQSVDWREIAFMLNGANEVLTEKVHELNQEYARLQAQHKKTQDLTLFAKKELSPNN